MAMATLVCRNGCFTLPSHSQSCMEKKIHLHRLGAPFKPLPAADSFSSTLPSFSSLSLDCKRPASCILVQTALLEQEKEETTFGLPSLPYNASSTLSVESWGGLYEGPFEAKYWNSNGAFPYSVGYTSIKTYKGKQFLQRIEKGSDGPLFFVELIGENKIFSSTSPQKVWNDVVEQDGQQVKGSRHFGFQSPDVIKVLQTLAMMKKSSQKEEALSRRVSKPDDDLMSSADKGHISDVTETESDREFAQAQMLFEEYSDVDEAQSVREDVEVGGGDDDDDDGIVATAAATEEEEEEEEEEEDGDEDDDIVDVVAAIEEEDEEDDEDEDDDDDVLHDVGDNHDHDLESDDGDNEEDGNERGPLLYNVYSSTRRVISDDDSPTYDETEPLLNNYKQSFRSTLTRSDYDRHERDDSVDETYKEGLDSSSNDVYHPLDHGKFKGSGRIWRKGNSLAGHIGGYGKQHGGERSGIDQRYPFNEGSQPRGSTALSFNGSRSWDGPSTRKREESSKSSQMLLELLQKWNRSKRWNREQGASARPQVEGKKLLSKEDNEQQHDVSWRQERASNKVWSQGHGSDITSRAFEVQELVQSGEYSSASNGIVLDDFKICDDADESTDYAISKLFETVKKPCPPNGVKALPRLGKSAVVDSPSLINHVEKSWSGGAFSRPSEVVNDRTRLEWTNDVKDTKEETERRRSNGSLSVRDLKGKSTQVVSRKMASLPKEQIEEIRIIEDVKKMVGDKRYEDAISIIRNAKASSLDLQEGMYEAFLGDIKLEAWQKQVFRHVQDGNSVLVSAPSGAGKSTVADCCLFRNFLEEHRSLYVTPSEHLANEKLNMLGSIFGRRNVGGTRTKMNKDHQVGVITLETLARMLKELNGPGGSEFRFFFEGVNMVVLDKFHTFSEATYVSMWEEVFMLMDAKIKVLALTLPLNNEEQVVSWIDMYRGPCKLVSSRMEAVSRRYFFCDGKGLFPLLNAKGVQLNDDLARNGSCSNTMTKEDIDSFFVSCYDKPSLKLVLSLLEENAMLPAFVAFFDIKGCDDAMQDAFAIFGEGLLSGLELARLDAFINELGETHPDLLKHLQQADRDALRKGFAACHEGKLPAWQTFVLKLFQENIVKLLIVTENISLYSDIVARTVILPATHKMKKDGDVSICPVQVLPLVGSAGRRGYDIEGNVVFLKNFFSGPSGAAALVLKTDFKIVSSYKPSYCLVANLMAKYNLSKVKQLLGSTFRDVLVYNTLTRDIRLRDVDKKILDCLEAKAEFEVKLFQGLAQVNKQKLVEAAVFTRVDIRMTVHSASHSGNAFPGFLLAVVPNQSESFYMVFGGDNKFRLVPAGALDHVYTEAPLLDVQYKQETGKPLQPPAIPSKESWTVEHNGTGGYVASGDQETRLYAKLLMDYPVQVNVVKEGLQLRKEILSLDTQISNLIGRRRSLHVGKQSFEPEHAGSTEAHNWVMLGVDESDTWKEAMRLLKIMEQVDALYLTASQGAHVKLKPLGMLISRLHNVDNALWLALVLSLTHVQQLPPGEFMAIVAATVPLETKVEGLFSDQRELLYRSTRPLKEAFAMVEVLRKQVAALQGSFTPPLYFCTPLAGMVYAWARGKPGSVGFNMENTNNGEVAWKLRSVTKYANLVSQACSQVSVDILEPNDFSSLSVLARRAEEIMSRHFVASSKII